MPFQEIVPFHLFMAESDGNKLNFDIFTLRYNAGTRTDFSLVKWKEIGLLFKGDNKENSGNSSLSDGFKNSLKAAIEEFMKKAGNTEVRKEDRSDYAIKTLGQGAEGYVHEFIFSERLNRKSTRIGMKTMCAQKNKKEGPLLK